VTIGKLAITTTMTVDGLIDVGVVRLRGSKRRRRPRAVPRRCGDATRPEDVRGARGLLVDDDGGLGRPAQPDAEVRRVANALGGPLEWNATLLEGDAAEAVSRLKEERQGDLVGVGCGEFGRYLLENRMVDELRFWIHPALGGTGARPFEGTELAGLRLLGSEAYDSGVTLLRYAPAG
jgi:RibD C-terminal domain